MGTLYGQTAAALYAKAAGQNAQARQLYNASADTYYKANDAAAYDDWVRARNHWDYFYNLQQFGYVESGLLENLTLLNMDLVKRVSRGGGLGDVGSHRVGEQFGDDLSDVGAGDLTSHDIHHFLSDCADLGSLSIGRFLDLILSSFGECNAEETKLVTISGGGIDVSLDLCLPLLDDGALLVASQFHSPM